MYVLFYRLCKSPSRHFTHLDHLLHLTILINKPSLTKSHEVENNLHLGNNSVFFQRAIKVVLDTPISWRTSYRNKQ